MSNHKSYSIIRGIFFLYCAIVLILLFCRSQFDLGLPYWEQIRMNLNLIPFRSISIYLYLLIHRPNKALVFYSLTNFIGNIVLFIPFGFLFPCLERNKRSLMRMLLTALRLISLLEIAQLLTLLGSFDVDDIILNLSGVALGYLPFHIARRKWNITL
ncbi:MAG: VanZ family protein [Oscillospiraceae bacterium]|nr:VanZ family protein [Oscillospiraceae bacterium]